MRVIFAITNYGWYRYSRYTVLYKLNDWIQSNEDIRANKNI